MLALADAAGKGDEGSSGSATKLRLTNQSRYTPATATRQTRQPFGYIDENGRQKPWDMHG
jgi:hypothetical protein